MLACRHQTRSPAASGVPRGGFKQNRTNQTARPDSSSAESTDPRQSPSQFLGVLGPLCGHLWHWWVPVGVPGEPEVPCCLGLPRGHRKSLPSGAEVPRWFPGRLPFVCAGRWAPWNLLRARLPRIVCSEVALMGPLPYRLQAVSRSESQAEPVPPTDSHARPHATRVPWGPCPCPCPVWASRPRAARGPWWLP